MKDVVVLGSSGFAQEMLWLLEHNNEQKKEWNILGFVDNVKHNSPLAHYDIIGDDEWLLHCPHSICVVCGIGSPILRRKIVNNLKAKNCNISFPSIISRSATTSPYIRMGEGCVVCAGAVITTNVSLDNFVAINLGCHIGHETVIHDFVTINPGSNISGNVCIGEACDIGTGTSIIQGKKIGANSIIGAGSVIIRDVPEGCTVVGNPGRVLER